MSIVTDRELVWEQVLRDDGSLLFWRARYFGEFHTVRKGLHGACQRLQFTVGQRANGKWFANWGDRLFGTVEKAKRACQRHNLALIGA